MKRFASIVVAGVLAAALLPAGDSKLSLEERAHLIRGLNAEFGSAKITIPRSKKPLEMTPKARFDVDEWSKAMEKFGAAARLGDLVQITKVEFKKKNKLVLQLNHGIKGGRKWWHNVQVSGSMGRGQSLGDSPYAPGGTTLAIVFDDSVPALEADEVKKMLKPILDFEKRTATELFVDKLPEEFQTAIEEERVMEGMDRDMVLLALGRPDKKVREFKGGVETEDWIFGLPPGDVTFVTFRDEEVVKIKHSFATIGGEQKTYEDAVPE